MKIKNKSRKYGWIILFWCDIMHAGEIMDLIEQLLSDAEIVDAYNEIDSFV
mgnify:CR=1 FL=1